MPHLVCFVLADDVERAKTVCASIADGPLKGAAVSDQYARVWALLPKWARVRVAELDAAGIRNFAVLNVGGDALVEMAHG